jgi:hypothetical protein
MSKSKTKILEFIITNHEELGNISVRFSTIREQEVMELPNGLGQENYDEYYFVDLMAVVDLDTKKNRLQEVLDDPIKMHLVQYISEKQMVDLFEME